MVSQYKTEYDTLVQEYFDLNDTRSRRFILSLNEAEENQLLVNLTNKLYQKIVEKVDQIDYGTIPKSAGDITKIENYASMCECLKIIRDIVKQYRQNEEPINYIESAIENVKVREREFSKAFAMHVQLGELLYDNIVMAIVASISYLIATSIEFIKSPTDDTFEVSLDKVAYKKTSNAMLFNDLQKFNIACKNGEVDKVLHGIADAKVQKLTGKSNPVLSMSLALLLVPLSVTILPLIQDIVYIFYYTKQHLSDYFGTQADLLQLNQTNIIYRQDIDSKKKKDIITSQRQIVEKLRKISNFFAIDAKVAEKKASEEKKANKKKYTPEELGADTSYVDNVSTSSDVLF